MAPVDWTALVCILGLIDTFEGAAPSLDMRFFEAAVFLPDLLLKPRNASEKIFSARVFAIHLFYDFVKERAARRIGDTLRKGMRLMKSFGLRLGMGAITVVLAAYIAIVSRNGDTENVSRMDWNRLSIKHLQAL